MADEKQWSDDPVPVETDPPADAPAADTADDQDDDAAPEDEPGA